MKPLQRITKKAISPIKKLQKAVETARDVVLGAIKFAENKIKGARRGVKTAVKKCKKATDKLDKARKKLGEHTPATWPSHSCSEWFCNRH